MSSSQAVMARGAYASFFLTGHAQFWGSAFHVERFIDAVKASSEAARAQIAASSRHPPPPNKTVLVDVGAAPYNTVGGDISHVLTFLKHWPAESGATIFGFEPGTNSYSRLVRSIEGATGRTAVRSTDSLPSVDSTDGGGRWPTTSVTHAVLDSSSAREWIVLRNAPVSDRPRLATISNQPAAGDNTASLEPHYQTRTPNRKAKVRLEPGTDLGPPQPQALNATGAWADP